jgi:hypothetical protein
VDVVAEAEVEEVELEEDKDNNKVITIKEIMMPSNLALMTSQS